jgi:hypothetical protein
MFLPIEATKIWVSVDLTVKSPFAFSSRIENTLSIPIDTPTAGIYLPENMPTRPSYLPPPAIEPTLSVSVSTAS